MRPVAAGGSAGRVVVVHGEGDPSTIAALRAVGLELLVEVGDTAVWAPPDPGRDGRTGAEQPASGSGRLLLSVTEAAAVLGVGRTTAYELIAAGQLETVHIGRCARVPAAAVEELVERLRARAGAASRAGRTLGPLGPAAASQPHAAVEQTAS